MAMPFRPRVPQPARAQPLRAMLPAPPRVLPQAATPATPFAAVGGPIMSTYPGVLDVAPVLVDAESPMVALWINLLQLIVEAVESEIGPLPSGMRRSTMPGRDVNSLQRLLGQQTDGGTVPYGESYAGLCTAVAGNGKPAGTLYGVQRIQVTRSAWAQVTDYTTTIINPFGPPPRLKMPVAWGVPRQIQGVSMNTVFTRRAAKVVARVNSINVAGTVVTNTVQYAAATCDSTGTPALTPVNGQPSTFDICLLYMCTEEDA